MFGAWCVIGVSRGHGESGEREWRGSECFVRGRGWVLCGWGEIYLSSYQRVGEWTALRILERTKTWLSIEQHGDDSI